MSKESTEQGKSGQRGAEASQMEGAGDQPRQGSRRNEVAGESEPKHHFAPGHAPSEQGDKSNPSPGVIAEHQQGVSGSRSGQSGSHDAHEERTQEIASRDES